MTAEPFSPHSRGLDATGVHIVRGIPDDEEVAALVAGLAAFNAFADDSLEHFEDPGPGPSRWVRGRIRDWNPHSSPDTWRWSGRA